MADSNLIKKLTALQGDGNRKDLARRLKISPGFLSDLFNGNRAPGPALLKKLGLSRREIYVEVK